MKLVLFGFEVPGDHLRVLKELFGTIYEFEEFNTHHFDKRQIREAEVLVLLSSNGEVISEASACKWIHSWSAGVDDYLLLERFRGPSAPLLTNSAGSYGSQISEHVFAMIFAFTRGIKTIVLNQEKRKWEMPSRSDEGSDLSEITGKTMGVVGLGHVGLEVARTGKAFGLNVLGVKRDASLELKVPSLKPYVDEIYSTVGIATVLSRSDFVINALPLTNETKGLFDSANFSKFKEGAIFISVGRGGTVIENDLVAALRKGEVSRAAIDVFSSEPLPGNSPLWKLENVIVSPHCAGRSVLHSARAYSILRDNLTRYSLNQPLLNRVDMRFGY